MARTSFARISRADIAERYSFVYCIHAYAALNSGASFQAAYIGQTRNRFGAIGRLSQHLSGDDTCNTFKQRIGAISKDGEVRLNDISFIACPLSPLRSFHLEAPDYREAVEALVQDSLIGCIVRSSLKMVVVSRVSYNSYVKEAFVQQEANGISKDIFDWLNGIYNGPLETQQGHRAVVAS